MTVITLKNKNYQSTLTAPFDIDLGGMIPLSTTTLSSTASTVTFSDIPQHYEHLHIRGIARTDRSLQNDILRWKFNSDTAANYSVHTFNGMGSTVESGGSTSQGYIQSYIIGANTATSNVFGMFVADILDYRNINKYKTLRQFAGIRDTGSNSNGAVISLSSGLWMSTSAITRIDLTSIGNYMSGSSFELYGIKRAGA